MPLCDVLAEGREKTERERGGEDREREGGMLWIGQRDEGRGG